MTKINIKNFSLDSLKTKFKHFKKNISSNYFCIEFGYDYVQFAEAFYSKSGIGYKNVLRKDLPLDALDKGIPSDPQSMGILILKIMEEENINLKRAAITLSNESIYSRLLEIPNTVSEKR